MGEFMMITFLSVFAIYGIFDVLYSFLFSEKNLPCYAVIEDIYDEKSEYNIRKYINEGYEIIVLREKDDILWENYFEKKKIHIIDKEIFTQYFQ